MTQHQQDRTGGKVGISPPIGTLSCLLIDRSDPARWDKYFLCHSVTLSHFTQFVQFSIRLGLSLSHCPLLDLARQEVPQIYFLDLKSVIRRTVLLFLDEDREDSVPARQFVEFLIDKTFLLEKCFQNKLQLCYRTTIVVVLFCFQVS